MGKWLLAMSLVGVLLVGGCGALSPPTYRAVAVIRVDPSEAMASASARIEALGRRHRTGRRQVRVEPRRHTTLIDIVVTADSARDAADTCNAIAEAYVSATRGKGAIVVRAEAPRAPVD